MEAKATVKYVRISPPKARRAVDLVRGRQVEEARGSCVSRRSAPPRRSRRRSTRPSRTPSSSPASSRRTWSWTGRGSTRARRSSAGVRAPTVARPRSSSARRTSRSWSVRWERMRSGSQGQPVRVPSRGHLPLEVQLVRRSGLLRPAPRGHLDPQAHPLAPVPRRHLEHRHRAQGRPDLGLHPARAGHRDRSQGRRGGQDPQGRRARDEEAGRREGRGHELGGLRDAPRDRCDAARAGRGRAARRPRVVPPRDAPAVQTAMRSGALGVRAHGGRLGGAEMSRREWYREGRVPLHTPARRSTSGRPRARRRSGRSA